MAGPQIRFSADPSAALSALQRIRNELAQVGQEARSLSQIDIGALPTELASDVQRVIQQYNELLKISGSLRGHINATGQADVAPWNLDYNRLYMDPRTAGRRINQTVQRITAGTPYAPPSDPGGAAGAAGGAAGSGGGGLGTLGMGGLGRLAGMLPHLRFFTTLAGIGGAAKMGGDAFSDAVGVAGGTDQVFRTSRYSGLGFDALRDQIRKVGDGFGVMNTEAVKLVQTFQKGSTVIDRYTLMQETHGAIGFAKGTGMDLQAAVQSLAHAQGTGVAGSRGSMSQKEYAMLIGETIARGGMFAKGEHVMDAFGRYVDQLQSVTREAPTSMGEFSSLLGSLYSLKDAPGMKYGGAESIISALNHGVMSPGAGEAGQFFMQRALGRYFNNDPHAMMYAMENGALSVMPGTDVTPLQAVMRQLDLEMGPNSSPFARFSAMKNLFPGLSMHDAKYLEDAYRAEQDRGDGGLSAMLSRAGINPNMEAIGNLSRIYAATNDNELRNIANEFSGSAGISKEKAAEIQQQAGALSGNELREYLASVANNDIKYLQTPMSQMAEASRQLNDTFEELIGEKLLPIVTEIKDAVAKIAEITGNYFGGISEWFSNPGEMLKSTTKSLWPTDLAGKISGWFSSDEEAPSAPPVGSREWRGKITHPEPPSMPAEPSSYQPPDGASSAPVPSSAAAAGGTRRSGGGSRKDAFVREHMDGARKAAAELGVDPLLLIGQMGLETGWGRSVIPGTNNLGNIKAGRSWRGPTVRAYDRAEGSNDPYRVYASTEDFWKDYADLIKRSYPGVEGAGTDARKFAEALKAGGYATDQHYVDKLTNTIMGIQRTSLDSAGVPPNVASTTAPDARAPEMSQSKLSGELSIVMQHQDPYGREIGPGQRAQMSLSRNSTPGTIRVPDLFAH